MQGNWCQQQRDINLLVFFINIITTGLSREAFIYKQVGTLFKSWKQTSDSLPLLFMSGGDNFLLPTTRYKKLYGFYMIVV